MGRQELLLAGFQGASPAQCCPVWLGTQRLRENSLPEATLWGRGTSWDWNLRVGATEACCSLSVCATGSSHCGNGAWPRASHVCTMATWHGVMYLIHYLMGCLPPGFRVLVSSSHGLNGHRNVTSLPPLPWSPRASVMTSSPSSRMRASCEGPWPYKWLLCSQPLAQEAVSKGQINT